MNTLYEKRYIDFLEFVRKQHLVKVTLYANMLIGHECMGGLVIKTTLVKIYTFFLVKLIFITSQDSNWELGS